MKDCFGLYSQERGKALRGGKQSDLIPEKLCCKSGCPRVFQGPATWQVGDLWRNDDDDDYRG